jgi:extracellular elastinolytic metalloproteinase
LKRDQVGPVEALKGVSSIFGLSITTTTAVAKPEESAEHYTIEGTNGAYQDPKARLVYLQTPENALSLTWRVETDLSDDWSM